jgi:preprotein translocase subunit SecA
MQASSVRNRIGWRQRLSRLQGSAVRFDLSHYDAALAGINGLESTMRALTDAQMEARARELRGKAIAVDRPEIRANVFALAREASHRVLGLRPFDVQVVAALALDEGAVIEMQTGEGRRSRR